MPSAILIPLEVIGHGIVISYGIALMMKIILICIRAGKKPNDKEGGQE